MGAAELAKLFVWYLVFVFSTTFHEFAHAWAAYRGGDATAYQGGQLSLDPVPHVVRSPFGMVLVPLLSYLTLGWMLGWASVPFDPRWASRHPRRHALMSLAGPAANLALCAVALGAIKALLAAGLLQLPATLSYDHLVEAVGSTQSSPMGALAVGLSILLYLNALLGLFNLLPIPPLDGAGVVEGLAPRTVGPLFQKLRENSWLELLGLLVAWKVFSYIAHPLAGLILRLVYA
ncbi:MAG: site-2 protease family protein [Polyangiaceae bacterium]|nr:site-2 protease family protein [Polyangiaceae bacterium]